MQHVHIVFICSIMTPRNESLSFFRSIVSLRQSRMNLNSIDSAVIAGNRQTKTPDENARRKNHSKCQARVGLSQYISFIKFRTVMNDSLIIGWLLATVKFNLNLEQDKKTGSHVIEALAKPKTKIVTQRGPKQLSSSSHKTFVK